MPRLLASNKYKHCLLIHKQINKTFTDELTFHKHYHIMFMNKQTNFIYV